MVPRLSIGNIVKWEISKLIGLDHSIFSLVCCRLCRVCIRHLETSLSFITSYESLEKWPQVITTSENCGRLVEILYILLFFMTELYFYNKLSKYYELKDK